MADRSAPTPRALALSILKRCSAADSYANLTLDYVLRRQNLSAQDSALLTALVYGTIERQVSLDYYLAHFSDLPLNKIDEAVLWILRTGLYQILYMERIPPHAAVNESVSLAPRRSAGFVNAVLRTCVRCKESDSMPPLPASPEEALSVRSSVPLPLCLEFIRIFGFEKTEAMFAAWQAGRKLCLRVNTLKTDRATLTDLLNRHQIEAIPTSLSPNGLLIDEMPVQKIPGFSDGLFFIQDEASQLCVEALQAQPGDTVLDCCACPGSKSFGTAMRMQDKGLVLANDLHANKLSLIASGAERLGVSVIKTNASDARTFAPAEGVLYDRILCDVPCSGYGVLGKKPEIRHKPLQTAAGLPEIQLAILRHAATLLAPGGRLVYSTCTLLPQENEQVIEQFLESRPDFRLCPTAAGGLDISKGLITLTPDMYGTDGFFIAVLERKND
ncbi:MAG: 16S rRNA (cytosine(967)-C(5))-methyltransferase RsmB [Clostridia bacterium]|nr:16S rRNA (cytosine(967)-C(5))-methyltransferase RsmB [Clostridia bacterium]